MKLASIQLSVVEDDKSATLDKASKAVRAAGDADLIILPEIWNIGFMSFDRYESEAETMDGPTPSLMRELARETGSFVHTGSFVETDGKSLYNTSLLLSPQGETLAVYRKIHLFGYNSKETQILTPGTDPVVADTPFGPIGMATCFDLRFPELFRALVDQGARIFLVCSAWPYPRLPAWSMLCRVRALENQAFLVSANAAGMNRGAQFVGHSMVADPWGTILAGAGDLAATVRTDIDLEEVTRARETFPGLAGRKPFLNPGPASNLS